MKIINLVQKPQLRGAEIFACQLSNHLGAQGHEVIVVSIFEGDAELPHSGKTIHLNRPISKRFYDIHGWKKFNDLIKDFQPDIVQANAADTLKFASSSKMLFSWKPDLIYRNANKAGDFIDSKVKWGLNKFYLSQVAYVISVSKECEKDFIKTYDYPTEKIETVEIGVEKHEITGIPEDLKSIYEKGPVIVHIGGFVPEKNHNGLIDIFDKVREEFPGFQLLLIGKGRLRNQIEEKTRKLNLSSNVHFLNYRTDVLEILYHADAFTLPSLIEGLPAVILESMYCETPVIAYNVGGIGEVVISGKTGWLVKKNDKQTFGNCVTEVLKKSPQVEKNVSAAKNMISKRFMNEVIAKRFTRCYEAVLAK